MIIVCYVNYIGNEKEVYIMQRQEMAGGYYEGINNR